jgi:heptosyltransferase III
MNAPKPPVPPPGIPDDDQDRLVIVHQGALGDLMLALPAFDGLARLQPSRRLDFWGRPNLLALLATKSYLGEVRSCDGGQLLAFFQEETWQQAMIPDFFLGTAAVFLFGQEQSRTLARRLQQRLNAPVVWIKSFPDPAQLLPVSRFLVDQVRTAGWPISHDWPQLTPADDEIQPVREWFRQEGWEGGKTPVLIHPGSGGPLKAWPLQRWWHLIHSLLHEARVAVILVLGPADDAAKPLAAAVKSMGAHLATDISLPRLAALASQCRLLIGNDSGVTHLAAALGTPTIAIFGPTCSQVWAPRGTHVQVIQSHWEASESLVFYPAMTPEPVDEAVQTAVARILGN